MVLRTLGASRMNRMEIEYRPDFVRCRIETDNPLPLIVEPCQDSRVEPLIEWLSVNRDWAQEKIAVHGAILLRGFALRDAEQFAQVCRAITPGVNAKFVGTPGTRMADAVYPSSEGPTMYPIPMHCELMYSPHPPRWIHFGCLVPPEPRSGETPLVDNRRVWRNLDPAVRDRFIEGGDVRIVRNLCGPNSGFRIWTLVRWDDFFVTTDRNEVESQCRSEGWEFEWTRDDGLKLTIYQPFTRDHPVTGETAWCNQLLSYDATSTSYEFRRLYGLRPSFPLWRMWQFVRTTAQLKKRSPVSTLPAYCTWADGSPIPEADRWALRKTVWKNIVCSAWEPGDVMAVDNFATSHGRYPAWGRRKIVACMA